MGPTPSSDDCEGYVAPAFKCKQTKNSCCDWGYGLLYLELRRARKRWMVWRWRRGPPGNSFVAVSGTWQRAIQPCPGCQPLPQPSKHITQITRDNSIWILHKLTSKSQLQRVLIVVTTIFAYHMYVNTNSQNWSISQTRRWHLNVANASRI